MRNSFNLVIAIVLTIVSCTVKHGAALALKETVQHNAVRCGSQITDPYGGISHKQFENADPNERCVWILRLENGTQALINVTYIDDPSTLSVFALSVHNHREEWVPSRTGDAVILNNANVIVITFHTGPNATEVGKGFQLVYQWEETNGVRANPSSMDYIETEDVGFVKHPINGTYFNNELSLFVFAPHLNHYDADNEIKVIYIESKLETVVDIVQVYSFDKAWTNIGSITGDLEVIRGSELIMLVFQTDNSVVFSGFQVTYTQSPKCSIATK